MDPSPAEIAAVIDAVGTAPFGPETTTKTLGGFVIVDGEPAALAEAAHAPLEVYALARMVASENGSEGALHLLATAEVARNEARRRGVSVSALLLASHVNEANGRFSEQAAGKWASTRRDPNMRHMQAAQGALVGSTVTGGAVDFFDPSSQDKGTQGGHTLRETSESYIAKRAAEGLAWIGPVAGIDGYHLMLFAPGKKPIDQAPALAELARGRAASRTGAAGLGVGALLVGLVLFFLVAGASA